MQDKRIALVTGANQGLGLQLAKELVGNGLTVLVGSRNFERGKAAASEIGPGAIALQLDVTDRVSIAEAAARIGSEFGCLDLLVNNAAISNTRKGSLSLPEYVKISLPSNVSLDEGARAVWETNVFGVLAVYQAMLPLLQKSLDARIVNVSERRWLGAEGEREPRPTRIMRCSALCILHQRPRAQRDDTGHDDRVGVDRDQGQPRLPAFTKDESERSTRARKSVEDGSREVVRVALLGPDGPTGTFTRWENVPIEW